MYSRVIFFIPDYIFTILLDICLYLINIIRCLQHVYNIKDGGIENIMDNILGDFPIISELYGCWLYLRYFMNLPQWVMEASDPSGSWASRLR